MIIPLVPRSGSTPRNRIRMGRSKRIDIRQEVVPIQPTREVTTRTGTSTREREGEDGGRQTTRTGLVAVAEGTTSQGLRTSINTERQSTLKDIVGITPAAQAGGSSSSFSAQSTIYVNSFPPNFPVDTPEPIRSHGGSRGYLFLENQQVLDSMLIFFVIFGTSLLLTITCIKCNSLFTSDRRGKVDNVIMEDMKWAEGREVVERRIIWETESIRSKKGGRRSALGLGSSGLRK
ncbi:hypothetical protein I302_107843 [Kwoniella bestiolae CBS 10118]|uniref:Uncharacterized protein n=1 Tax=Kwoniella bestiolae CBS 10118 TaxID=1296100 RepID=A0A1B9FXE4_9TREE|nr:hypothetical protein I302_06417 [Kwoniella bestiolae CBS 10118]OCF23435.1 hypothetical protein I302_06417 [Kwoniella bestiolae CBS 10118]